MSRATSAVDAAPVSGLPVVEHALPTALDAATYAFSSALVHGNATFSPAYARVWSFTERKHLMLSLASTPRGSTPTMSKRSSRSSPRK